MDIERKLDFKGAAHHVQISIPLCRIKITEVLPEDAEPFPTGAVPSRMYMDF